MDRSPFDRSSAVSDRAPFPLWRVVIGLLIVGYGALLTGDNLHWAPAYFILDRLYGPFAMVLVGAAGFVQTTTRGGRFLGGAVVVIGVLWFLESVSGVRVDFDYWWPLLIVAAGVWIILRSIETRDEGGPEVPAGPSQASAVAFWSGVHRRIASSAFSRADFAAVMGGIEVDLRPAATANGTAVIDVMVLMGGIEITVPPEWAVSNQAIVIMGGVEDKSSGAQSAAHTLVVRGLVVMGGVVIKT